MLTFFLDRAPKFSISPSLFFIRRHNPAGLNADFFERVRRHTHNAAYAFFVFDSVVFAPFYSSPWSQKERADEDDEYWW